MVVENVIQGKYTTPLSSATIGESHPFIFPLLSDSYPMESIVADFVNREAEYQGFQRALAETLTRSVRLIVAPEGMGKSYLLRRMHALALENEIPVALIDFRDRYAFDHLLLTRLIRDQFTSPLFNPLTAIINQLTQPRLTLANASGDGGVNVSDISGSTIEAGTIVGRDLIKDNQFFVNTESEVTRRAAEVTINDSFFICLAAFLREQKHKRVVLLFDSFEDVTPEGERWFRTEYLRRLGNPDLKGVVTMVAGRDAPDVPESVQGFVGRSDLKVFTEAHVREYIEVKKQLPGLDIATIYRTSGGLPGFLAKMALTASGSNSQKDDEWN